MMDTPAETKTKKKSNMTYYIILGGLGLLGIFLLSSFKASADSTAAGTCESNLTCLKGYWKWEMIKGWYQDIVSKATANGKSIPAQLDSEADWIIGQKWKVHDDFKQWEAMVTNETSTVLSMYSSMSTENARNMAVDNIISRLIN